jgi:hypothetical protein
MEQKRDWKHLQILLKREHILLSNLWKSKKITFLNYILKALQDTQQKTVDFSLILKDLQIVLSKADILALNKKFYSVLEDKTLQEILSSIGNISVEENTITDEIHLEGFHSHVKSTKTYLRKEKVKRKFIFLKFQVLHETFKFIEKESKIDDLHVGSSMESRRQKETF